MGNVEEQIIRAQPSNGWLIGAYAAAPSRMAWHPADEARYFDALADLPGVVGFEIPFTDALHKFDEQWLFDQLRPESTIVVTTAPGTSDHVRASAAFGLASCDPAGRRAAVDHAASANRAIERMNNALGRSAVVAVELHSAPQYKEGASSAAALLQSLEELAAWDWYGARIVVEHCDAAIPGQAPAKGYLRLNDEIKTVLEVNRRTNADIGIAINWGRSVIERRDPDGARRHVERAREAELLAGVMFSGCSASATRFGSAWADVHAPAAPETAGAEELLFDFLEPTSFMTSQRIAETLQAAGPLDTLGYRGIKTAAPPQATVGERITAVAQSLAIARAGLLLLDEPASRTELNRATTPSRG